MLLHDPPDPPDPVPVELPVPVVATVVLPAAVESDPVLVAVAVVWPVDVAVRPVLDGPVGPPDSLDPQASVTAKTHPNRGAACPSMTRKVTPPSHSGSTGTPSQPGLYGTLGPERVTLDRIRVS